MSILSKQSIAASIADFSVKKLLDDHVTVATVAAAGSLISDGTPLAYGRNMVTAANATKAVVLPDAKLGSMVEVVNTVSNQALPVFPKLAGDQINAVTAGAAFTQAAGSRAAYFCDAAGHWYVAAANLTGVATSASQAELDVLDGALDTNAVAAKAAILGTGGALTLGGALTAVTSIGIGSAVLSEAEMEMLDGITGGTQLASKAIVNDANVNQGVAKVTQLHIGTSGSETQVLATGLEINRAADVSTRLVAAGATELCTVADHDGKIVMLDTAGGSVCTLPVAAATGAVIKFLVTVRPSGASHVIKVGNASDFMYGQIHMIDEDANAVTGYTGDGSADDTITINNTTTGGAIGDYIECVDTLANRWSVRGHLTVPAGSNVADPLSATV